MTNTIDNRPLFQLTVYEFQNLLTTHSPEVKPESIQVLQERKKIKGIRGLADFLEVSLPTAQKLKNNKLFPFYESGNKVYFYSDEVDNGLKVNAKEKGKLK
jgi:Protein of unknown function (DUF3853)